MTSVAQIVRGIIDDLSDGVSELVLLVVVMSEQNADVPPPLPVAAGVVNQTANTLANIARELARTDYVEFDEIVSEINEAATAVEKGTATMDSALTVLQGPGDRRKGWNGLCDACRVMSGKTIRLLQIVYGADLKRLQLTADQLMESIGAVVSPVRLNNRADQQKFVNDLQHITPKALKLAQIVRDKADATDNPFSQDLLRKMAKDLTDSVNDVIATGNKALQNPTEWGPKFDEKLANLKDNIARAKALATKEEPTPTAPPKDIRPLIQKAKEEVAKVPAAIKTPGPPFQRQEKAAKEAVQEVIRQIKPNPKSGKHAPELEQNLLDMLNAARNALRGGNPGQNDPNVDNAAQALIDALNNLRKTAGEGGKVNADDMNDIMNALNNLKGLGRAIANNPSAAEQLEHEKFKDDLARLKEAVKNGDMKNTPKLVKKAAQQAKVLADAMRADANNPDKPPWQRQKKLDAANDIEKLLPSFINKSKGALGAGLKDDDKNNEMLDAIRRLKRGADRGNAPGDDDFSNFLADLLAGLKKTERGANDGNAKDVDEGLAAIRAALANLKKSGERIAENHPNRKLIDEPLAELERQVNNLGDEAKKAARGDTNARNNLNQKTAPAIRKAADDLDKATNASKIKPIADVERKLQELMGAVDVGDPTRLTPAAKALVEKVKDLENYIQTLPAPQRQKLQQEYDKLQPLMRDVITKAKEAILNPDKPGLVDEAHDAANAMKVPLARMKQDLDQEGYQRPVEGEGAQVKKALQDLRDALASGDPARIREAMNNLKNAMAKYNGEADNHMNKKTDPKKREILKAAIEDLQDKTRQVRAMQNHPEEAAKIKSLMDGVEDSIDRYFDAATRSKDDDLLTGAAQAANLLAMLGSLGDDDMDLGDLLSAAGQLGNLLRGLIGDTNATARKFGANPDQLTDAARAAMELDQLLCRLEGKPDPYPKLIPENAAPLEIFQAAPEHLFVKVDLNTATSFEDVVAGVAYQIHEQAKGISLDADNIALELANLAAAARAGNRSDLLKAARAAAAYIAVYVKKLLELAATIPGNTPQERRLKESLHRAASNLRDMGTQLKILAAVKAATIEDSKDTDATLTTLTRNLGEMLKEDLLLCKFVKQPFDQDRFFVLLQQNLNKHTSREKPLHLSCCL